MHKWAQYVFRIIECTYTVVLVRDPGSGLLVPPFSRCRLVAKTLSRRRLVAGTLSCWYEFLVRSKIVRLKINQQVHSSLQDRSTIERGCRCTHLYTQSCCSMIDNTVHITLYAIHIYAHFTIHVYEFIQNTVQIISYAIYVYKHIRRVVVKRWIIQYTYINNR